MARPILTLTTKDFLTGIAPSAHTERGGLFFTANGVTPTYDPGGTASVENGLLQPGPAPTNIGGDTVTGTVWAACSGQIVSTIRAFFYDNDGKIYQLLTNGTLTNAHDGDNNATPDAVSNPRPGLVIYQGKLHYWTSSHIGTYNGTTWNDTAIDTLGTTGNIPAPHVFLDRVYYLANSQTYLSFISGSTEYSNVLDWDIGHLGTAISNDGVYLAIAITDNTAAANVFATCRVLFWDTYSSSWNREYEIRDPFIWAMKRMGNSVYAFGQYGIYEVSFGGGVRKILSRQIGFGTSTDITDGFGAYRADIYNQQALLFATDTTIDTLGQLAPDLPAAYFKHFKVPTSVGTPTCVYASFAPGAIYVATDGDKLYRYDFNNATRETSVSAQTIYIPLKEKTEITRIEVIFGEPLVSGDAMSLQLKTDEDTSATPTTAIVVSYANDGAVRRKSARVDHFITDCAISLVVNFTTGSPKIKKINVYGNPIATE
jgi:hypothetical protein